MSPSNFDPETFCDALDECAVADDALCEWIGMSKARLAALKRGAQPSPEEFLACVYVVSECWVALPLEIQRAVLARHVGDPRIPREELVQAIDDVCDAAKRRCCRRTRQCSPGCLPKKSRYSILCTKRSPRSNTSRRTRFRSKRTAGTEASTLTRRACTLATSSRWDLQVRPGDGERQSAKTDGGFVEGGRDRGA